MDYGLYGQLRIGSVGVALSQVRPGDRLLYLKRLRLLPAPSLHRN